MQKLLRDRRRDVEADDGVGLVEIIVAMFILAVLAITFLPILIQGLKQSTINATRATATQIVQDQMEYARAQDPNCSTVAILGTTPVANVVDSQGVTLVTTRTVGACPATYPGTVSVTVSVKQLGSAKSLTSATTLVYVQVF